MSGSQGSTKREGSRGVEWPWQLRRTVSRTKQRDGGASGSASVLTKHKGDDKVEQKSLNKIMLKSTLKTHQTMRDLSSTVWDTLLIKASSPETDNMQKQTQTYAEKVRQEGKGHTRGPPFVWAYLGLVKSLWQRATQWARERHRAQRHTGPDWNRSLQCRSGNEVRFCRLDKTSNADIKRVTLNIVSLEKRLPVLEAVSQIESERKYGRAPPTAME